MSRQRPPREDERSEARERAMMLLYEAEQRLLPASEVVAAQVVPPDELAALLVAGVQAHQDRIDGVISEHATGWTIARMPSIDRTVLRIATFELLERPDVPVGAVIDEAVELAKRFSTDDSGAFVNGVLAAIARSSAGER
jgi:transcription antitermination protein NusB